MPTRGVLLVASNGGHLLQLDQLRDTWEHDERHWVTFDKPDARSMLAGEAVTFAHHPTNRNVPNLLRNVMLALRLLLRLRPRAIVTTGAGVAVPFCWLGRALGSQVIYIESFARVNQLDGNSRRQSVMYLPPKTPSSSICLGVSCGRKPSAKFRPIGSVRSYA